MGPDEGFDDTIDLFIPTWDAFLDAHVVLPLAAQAAISLICVPMRKLYKSTYKRSARFRRLIDYLVGKDGKQGAVPFTMVALQIVQLYASIIQVVLYAYYTYNPRLVRRDRHVQHVLTAVFLVIYLLELLHTGFRWHAVWTCAASVDVLTLAPVILPRAFPLMFSGVRRASSVSWLNLRFLRVYRALLSYEQVMSTECVVNRLPELLLRLKVALLRLISLTVCMAGTIFTLEVLGEIPGLEPTSVPTNMGDLSFIQMNYWIITTISTVGYGDFSPTTVPSQLVIIVFIIVGVIFFGIETSELVELRSLMNTGGGKYTPRKTNQNHIVITGMGVSRLSSMLETFLLEVLTREGNADVPNVVLLSETAYDPGLKDFVRMKLEEGMDRQVFFLRGSPLSSDDLERVQLARCVMAFIFPGFDSADTVQEDKQNMLRALEMQRHCPGLRLRLMLLESGSEQRALALGVPRTRFFTATGIKASILAQSSRVKGLTTLVSGLLQVTSEAEFQLFLAGSRPGSWRHEYARGVQKQIYGFSVGGPKSADLLVGVPFAMAAARLYQESDGEVMLIAAQDDGRLMLNFAGELEEGQVVIAIARSRKDIRPFEDRALDWRDTFLSRRAQVLSQERMEIMRKGIGASSVEVAGEAVRLPSTGWIRSSAIRGPSASPPPPPTPATAVAAAKGGGDDDRAARGDAVAARGGEEGTSALERLERLRSSPGLIVLIVAEGAPAAWVQASMFVEALRQDTLAAAQQPIIVLSSTAAPEATRERFEGQACAFVSGEVLNAETLQFAGVGVAQAVVVFRGGAWEGFGTSHIVMEDYEVITLSKLIDQLHSEGAGEGGSDCCCVYEVGSTHAAALLSSVGCEHESEMMLVKAQHSRQVIRRSWCQRLSKSVRLDGDAREDLHPTSSGASQHALANTLSKQLLLLPSFAAGKAFSPDFFGNVLGHIYHFPATVEFIEAMCMPQRLRQTSCPWQVRCPPEWVGQTFEDLLQSWAHGKDSSGLLEGIGPVLVIALYRRGQEEEEEEVEEEEEGEQGGGDGGSWQGYNVTLPQGSVELASTDLVTLLGPPAFGRAAAEKSLLGRGWGPSSVGLCRDRAQAPGPVSASPPGNGPEPATAAAAAVLAVAERKAYGLPEEPSPRRAPDAGSTLLSL